MPGSGSDGDKGGHVDDGLVERAVADINTIARVRGLQMALEVGQYVVDAFFGGDAASASDPSGEHPSYRALARHDSLEMSHTMLWACVAVYAQSKALPGDVAESLSFSHHRALLPVPDAETERLAKLAVSEGLSVRELQQRVSELRSQKAEEDAPRRGRPPLPEWVKGPRKMSKLTSELGLEVRHEEVAAFGIEGTHEVLALIETQVERLADLKSQIELAMRQASSAGDD